MMDDELLTIDQAADILGIKRGSVSTRVHMLKLTPAQGGSPSTWRFTRAECERRKAAAAAKAATRQPFMRGAARAFQ